MPDSSATVDALPPPLLDAAAAAVAAAAANAAATDDVELSPLLAADAAAATATLCAAFAADPVLAGYLLQRGAGAAAAAQAFFSFNLRRGYLARPASLALCSVLRARGAPSSVLGVALWAPPGPPGSSGLPLAEMLRMAGIAVSAFGLLGIARALRTGLRVDAAHPSEPHYFLGFLAVAPASQGRGLGARLVAPVLARADGEGMPCYLENSNPRNTPFYQRLGFAVTAVIQLPGSGAPKIWAMRRAPRKAAAA